METSKDFEEFFALLNKHQVRYVVVGGYAYAIYAQPRYTKDLDIFYENTLGEARKILKVLKDFGFSSLEITVNDLTREGRIFQLGNPPLRIDLLNQIDGVSFDEVWENRQEANYGDQQILVIGKKELIKNKKATGRKQDLIDLENLE